MSSVVIVVCLLIALIILTGVAIKDDTSGYAKARAALDDFVKRSRND